MKKKLLGNFILIILIIITGCKTENFNNFKINGKLSKTFEGYIYLKHSNQIDSTLVEGTNFYFKGFVEKPTQAFIYPIHPNSKKQMGIASFYLENNTIDISISYDEFAFRDEKSKYFKTDTVIGSKNQDIAYAFDKIMEQTFYKQNDYNKKHLSLFKNLNQLVTKHPKSLISGEKVSSLNGLYGHLSSTELEQLLNKLDTNYQSKRSLNQIQKIISRRKVLDIGNTLDNIVLEDQNGKIIESRNINSKFLLIEFWASWCAPCRQTNPELLKGYNSFKRNDFEILGISLDSNKADWINAIKEDSLNWRQVLDKNKNIVNSLKISGIPYNILLDENRTIVRRNIKPSELKVLLDKSITK